MPGIAEQPGRSPDQPNRHEQAHRPAPRTPAALRARRRSTIRLCQLSTAGNFAE